MKDFMFGLLFGTLGAVVAIGSAEAQQRPETRVEIAYKEYVRNLIKDRPENQEYPRPLFKESFNNYQCLGVGEGFCPCCKANPLYRPLTLPPAKQPSHGAPNARKQGFKRGN